MVEFIIFTFFLILALLGLSELIHTLILHLLRPKKLSKRMLCVVLENNTACEQLAYIIENYRWQGKTYADEIIACTVNLSEAEKYECVERFKNNLITFTDSVILKTE